MHSKFLLAAAATLALAGTGAQAADWSDTSLGVRYGTAFAEPYNNSADGSSTDIAKTIVNLTHASGYKYGSFFINADFLLSDKKDPGVATTAGAQEVYAVFRHTLDIGKVSGANFKFGPVRGLGLTAGFDVNTKNDAAYGSKKRMFVVGPTVMFDVPGFLNLSALLLDESNAPMNVTSRFHYKNHGALQADWGIAIGALPLSFNGYAMYIGSKGKNEFGGDTAPETHVDMNLMLDVGAVTGTAKKTLLVGVAYEFWKNKFGNAAYGGAGSGAFAHTPMVRAEYHF